jgi:hypothetical protein
LLDAFLGAGGGAVFFDVGGGTFGLHGSYETSVATWQRGID